MASDRQVQDSAQKGGTLLGVQKMEALATRELFLNHDTLRDIPLHQQNATKDCICLNRSRSCYLIHVCMVEAQEE